MPGGVVAGSGCARRAASAAACLIGLACTVAGAATFENVRFRTYTRDQGLAQVTVRAIAQTTPGYVWLASQDGLSRFDGYAFRIYRHSAADPDSLPDNHVFALAADTEGGLWVAGQTGGIARYDPVSDGFARYQHAGGNPDSLASDRVTALHVATDGALWVGTREGTVQRLADAATGVFATLPLGDGRAAQGPLRAFLERSDGSVLAGGQVGLWECRDGACRDEWRVDGESLDVHAIAQSAPGEIWVATTSEGLVRFAASGAVLGRIRGGEGGGDGLAHDDTRALLFDPLGRLWVGTDRGLSRFETVSGPVKTWHHDPSIDDGLASDRVYSLYQGKDRLIWVGTWLNGVSVFDPRTEAFGTLRANPKDPTALPGSVVRAAAADPDGTLWLGLLEGGGLVRVDPARGVVARYTHDDAKPESLSNNNVQFVTRARDGALWIGTNGGGLDRLREDGTGFDHFRHDRNDPATLGSNAVLFVEVDRSGTLWVGLDGAGLDMRCARCSGFRHFIQDPDDPRSLPGNTISTVFESSSGEIWVGMRPGGLARFHRPSMTFERFRSDSSRPGTLSSDSITVMTESRDGTIWVGTQGGGLNRMLRAPDGSVSFRAVTRQDGLGADAIGAVFEAEDGRLWLSTTAGLTRYDPVSGSIENFSQRNGAQNSGYFIHSGAKLPDGSLVFGGFRGATIVGPSLVPAASALREPAITSFRPVRTSGAARGIVREVSPKTGPTSVLLPPELNDFTVEFSALSFVDAYAIQYEYRLDDYDQGWVRTDPTRRYATYTNLPPGDYGFRVRSRVNGGPPGPEAHVAITLEPPWWNTLQARIAYVLGAALLAFAVAWQVRARLIERERARRRIAESEDRLKLALWGSGSELWDYDVKRGEVAYMQPLPSLALNRDGRRIKVEELAPYTHPDDIVVFTSALTRAVRGDTEHLDVTYRGRATDGRWVWLRTRGRTVRRDERGRALRMVGTNDDIDILKRQEETLAELNRGLEQRVAERTADLSAVNADLKHTIEQLKLAQSQLVESEKMAALGGLVAGVAHEINTPLGIGVTAASHLEAETRRISKRMHDGEASREEIELYQRQAHEATEIILRNLRRADKLVKSFKQVAVDQSSENRRTLDLGAYLEEILTSLAPALKRGRHAIEVSRPQPVTVETYPGAIYQIVVNLVMNSITHGFEGGEQGRITIAVARIDGEVELDYRDNGRGMTEEVRRRAFEPFFTTRRGQGGSGLGLHIVYNLSTQVLRGRAAIESAPGQGFRFTLRFPA